MTWRSNLEIKIVSPVSKRNYRKCLVFWVKRDTFYSIIIWFHMCNFPRKVCSVSSSESHSFLYTVHFWTESVRQCKVTIFHSKNCKPTWNRTIVNFNFFIKKSVPSNGFHFVWKVANQCKIFFSYFKLIKKYCKFL